MSANNNGEILRACLEEAAAELGIRPRQAVVLAPKNDAFYWTAGDAANATWLRDRLAVLGLFDAAGNPTRTIHVRGVHYLLLGSIRPDGTLYANTEKMWDWIQPVVKAARWIGTIPFSMISDQRNDEPTIRIEDEPDPEPFLNIGLDISIPDPDDIVPTIDCEAFVARQPYRIALAGEKASLAPVLRPIVEARGCDLLLASGEASDTMWEREAAAAAYDGRKLVVLYFGDCDPGGWQMSISIAQKLLAFKHGDFHDIEFEVHRIGLLPEQVRAVNAEHPERPLPSSVIKETETRRGAWKEAMGVDQIEIDALAGLYPELLAEYATAAIDAFWDDTLDLRVEEAYEDWKTEAQAVVDEQLDDIEVERIRSEAAERLAELEAEIERLRDALHIDLGQVADLPDIDVPEPDDVNGLPSAVVDSDWGLAQGLAALKASKRYEEEP